MSGSFIKSIENSTAHRKSRDFNSECVFGEPALLSDLMEIALDPQNKIHFKACWILELVLEKHIDWLSPYLDGFCSLLPSYSHDGALRSVSKICLFASKKHIASGDFLSGLQVQQITDNCFDWLISDQKVATKAYAMRALFEFGKLNDGIYPVLRPILEQDYAMHSAAYKAATKDLLRRMK
jgi:hypothetical protein